MRPTIWLKNENDEIWNLRPKDVREDYSSFFHSMSGTGFETKLSVAQVKYDFVVTEETPKQVNIEGEMYFHSQLNLRRFDEFVGGFANTVRFYYDPEGKIDPQDQISKPWYKICKITKLTSGEVDKKTGMWVCKMVFTPLSAMWRRDTTIASSTSLVVGSPHVYPYTYPYFYTSERRLYLNILNEGERIGCTVSIKNKGTAPLEKLEWEVASGNKRQYAKWLDGVGLQSDREVLIDSNPSTQQSVEIYGNSYDDIADYQESDPQFINFVDLYPGDNQFIFNLGTVEDVEVSVTYTEQVRAL